MFKANNSSMTGTCKTYVWYRYKSGVEAESLDFGDLWFLSYFTSMIHDSFINFIRYISWFIFDTFHSAFKITCYQFLLFFHLQAGCASRFPANRVSFSKLRLFWHGIIPEADIKYFQSSTYFSIFTVGYILDLCKVSKGWRCEAKGTFVFPLLSNKGVWGHAPPGNFEN